MNNNQPPSCMTEIPFSRRRKLWLIAWVVGLIAAGFPNPALIAVIWCFPLGLMNVVRWDGYADDYLIVGWLFYGALTVVALMSRPRVLYFTLYIILCILLLLNIVGCHQMNALMK